VSFAGKLMDGALDIGRALLELASKHPDAVKEIGKIVRDVSAAKDPFEFAKRVAASSAAAAASEEALKKALGRKTP
jgi:hypothetical protein